MLLELINNKGVSMLNTRQEQIDRVRPVGPR